MAGIRKNAIANAAGMGWSAIVTLAVVPVHLHFLGVEAYGLIGFLASLQAVAVVLDMGLSTTANRELAKRGAGAAGESRDLVRTLEVVYGALGILIAAVLALASGWIATDWIESRDLTPGTVRWAIVIFGIMIGIRWPVSLYTGVLRGLERQVLLNGLAIAAATVRAVGGIVVLALVSPTVTALLTWTLVAGLLEVAAFAVVAWKVLPRAAGHRAAFRRSVLQSVWRFTASMTAITFFAAILKQLDKIVLSAVLPLEQMGYYVAAVMASRSLLLVPTAVFNAVFPRFTALIEASKEAELAALYHRSARVVAFLVAPLAGILMFFSYEALLDWTRSPSVASSAHATLSLLALATLFNSMMQVPFALQLASGMTWLPLWVNGVSAILLGPCIVLLALKFGIFGAAIAWTGFNVAYYAIVPQVLHRRLLRGHLASWILRDTLPFMAAATGVFGGLRLLSSGVTNRWALWGLVVVGGLVYAAVMVKLYPSLRGGLVPGSAPKTGSAAAEGAYSEA